MKSDPNSNALVPVDSEKHQVEKREPKKIDKLGSKAIEKRGSNKLQPLKPAKVAKRKTKSRRRTSLEKKRHGNLEVIESGQIELGATLKLAKPTKPLGKTEKVVALITFSTIILLLAIAVVGATLLHMLDDMFGIHLEKGLLYGVVSVVGVGAIVWMLIRSHKDS